MQEKSSLTIKLTLLTFAISLVIFSGIFYCKIPTDLQDHVFGLTLILKHHSFPVPPMYYFLLYLLSGFSVDITTLSNVAVVILSLAVAFKYYFSVQLIADLYASKKIHAVLNLAIWLLIFSAPIVYNYKQMLFGRIATNFWHNSTTILLMPFAILLQHQSIKFLKLKEAGIVNTVPIIVLGIVNVLIKPSFLFAFIPAFLMMVAIASGTRSQLFKMASFIVLVLGSLILIEYYAIYKMAIIDAVRFKNDAKGIEIKPFYNFLIFCGGSWAVLTVNVFVSLTFPVLCFCFFKKETQKDTSVTFVILLFLVSFLIGAFISEKGIMASNGNFMWQLHISNYMLFLILIKLSYDQALKIGFSNKKILYLIFTFGLHVASGLLYLVKIFYLKKYS